MKGERRVWLSIGLIILLTTIACGDLPGTVRFLAATPTATLTATATPTLAPLPTYTPTAIPTATPLPVTFSVQVDPESPAQGQTVVVRVTLDRAARVNGVFDGQALTFLYDSPTEAWALVGLPPWNEVGERQLTVEAVTADGQVARESRAVVVGETAFAAQNISVPQSQEFLLSEGLRPAEDEYLAAFLDEVTPLPLWDGPFGIPAEGIRTSPYGAHRSYQDGPVVSYHGGVDFAAPAGTAIFAPARGVVVMAEPIYVRGNTVILDHGAGVYSLYFHLSQLAVTPGQEVARGDFLGAMGSTGLSTGSHLHWEVRIGEIFVDPDEWLARSFP